MRHFVESKKLKDKLILPRMAEMAKYRKLPVVIEAVQFPYDGVVTKELADFVEGTDRLPYGLTVGDGYNYIRLLTLEGTMEASPGDFIIKGIKGELYPRKSDIFAATYEMI